MMKTKHILAAASCLSAAALASFTVSDACLKTTEYELNTGKSGSEICVAVLSDLHFSVYGKNNALLLSKVKKMNPDVIFVTGDFFDIHHGRSHEKLVMRTLRSLCAVADVYFTPGNHDLRFDAVTGKDSLRLAASAGCKTLNGNYFDALIKGRRVRIGGIFDYSVYLEDFHKNWHSSSVFGFLQDFEKTDSVKLLLMHRPNTFIYTEDEWDIDAVFCGHTHGGIWRLPCLGGVYAPEQGFLPKYDRGEFRFGNMKMFLSAGLEGYYLVPRFFNRPEILKITIK